MKGWIKVHSDNEEDVFVRASEIRAVYPEGEHTVINVGKPYYVVETVDEVLDLIDVAENTALLEKLFKLKNECEEQKARGGLCIECKGRGFCYALQGEPRYWSMKRIKEEYR